MDKSVTWLNAMAQKKISATFSNIFCTAGWRFYWPFLQERFKEWDTRHNYFVSLTLFITSVKSMSVYQTTAFPTRHDFCYQQLRPKSAIAKFWIENWSKILQAFLNNKQNIPLTALIDTPDALNWCYCLRFLYEPTFQWEHITEEKSRSSWSTAFISFCLTT